MPGSTCARCHGPLRLRHATWEPEEYILMDFCAHCEALIREEAKDIALHTQLTIVQAWHTIARRYLPKEEGEHGRPH